MIFSRSSLLGLAVILASSCATLERLVPNEQADVENQTQKSRPCLIQLHQSVKMN